MEWSPFCLICVCTCTYIQYIHTLVSRWKCKTYIGQSLIKYLIAVVILCELYYTYTWLLSTFPQSKRGLMLCFFFLFLFSPCPPLAVLLFYLHYISYVYKSIFITLETSSALFKRTVCTYI